MVMVTIKGIKILRDEKCRIVKTITLYLMSHSYVNYITGGLDNNLVIVQKYESPEFCLYHKLCTIYIYKL